MAKTKAQRIPDRKEYDHVGKYQKEWVCISMESQPKGGESVCPK